MILYHLDRSGQLPPTGTVDLQPITKMPKLIAESSFFDLFSNGVSYHCLNYFTNKVSKIPYGPTVPGHVAFRRLEFDKSTSNASHQIVEFTFELVRRLHFPECPSRLTALFAVDHPSQLTHEWGFSTADNERLYQVEAPEGTPRFDANHLRGGIIYHLYEDGAVYGTLSTALYDFAYKYWSGEATADPKWEYLITLPAALPRVEIPLEKLGEESVRHNTAAGPE